MASDPTKLHLRFRVNNEPSNVTKGLELSLGSTVIPLWSTEVLMTLFLKASKGYKMI